MYMLKKIKITAAAVLTAVLALLLTDCGAEKFDPEDYCDITVTGANGYAKAYASCSPYLLADVAKSLGEKATTREQAEALEAAGYVSFEIVSDKTENLSNGDVIEIQVDFARESAKDNGYFTFSKEKFKYKVKDLEDAIPLDPFDGLKIEYRGMSSKADVELDSFGCDPVIRDNVSFYCDAKNVANGDTITVTAQEWGTDTLMKMGYVMTLTSKDYVVSGLDEGKSLDPFEGLVLEYKGVSPKVSVSFDTKGCDEFVRNNVTFSTTENSYANGEVCKVQISYSESKAEDNGIVFTQEEKSFNISGAPEYAAGIDAVDFKMLEEDGKAHIESKLANDDLYVGSSNLSGANFLEDIKSEDKYEITDISFKPVKIYFASAKDSKSSTLNECNVFWEIKMTGKKTAEANGWVWTHDDLEIGQTATVVYLASVYYKNLAVTNGGKVSTDDLYMQCDQLWKRCANYSDNLKLTPDTICEEWRAKNAKDWDIEIRDYETK